MTETQYLGAYSSTCGRDASFATHRDIDTLKIYFFVNGTATLQAGYISVTPKVCEEGVGISPTNDSPDKNRRPRCPRASKHSQPSASSQLSQHAAASKKKKLLLLSRFSKSQSTTSTNIFAGRAFRTAPQNPFWPMARFSRAAGFPSDIRSPNRRVCAASWHARGIVGHDRLCTRAAPC